MMRGRWVWQGVRSKMGKGAWPGNWLRWVFKPCAIIDVSVALDAVAAIDAASAIAFAPAPPPDPAPAPPKDPPPAPGSPMAKCEPHFRKVCELNSNGARGITRG